MADQFDDIFKALADIHRRQILTAVCRKPMVAGELAELVGLAANAVSFHLKWLRAAGLVNVRREGRFLRYQAEPSAVSGWQGYVQAAFHSGEDVAAPGRAARAVGRGRRPKRLARTTPARSAKRKTRPTRPEAGPEARPAAEPAGGWLGDETLATELL